MNANVLWSALVRLPPRTAQLLMLRFVDGRSDAEAAELYGIPLTAFGVQVLRAARMLRRALESKGSAPLLPIAEAQPFAEERAEGGLLLSRASAPEAIEAAATVPASEIDQLAALLRDLRAHGTEIRALEKAHLEAELQSPAHRRKEWLRRIGLVALIALAVWLYRHGGR